MATTKDPVCGMDVTPAKAAGQSEYRGKTYYFCSPHCKHRFDDEPKRHARQAKLKSWFSWLSRK